MSQLFLKAAPLVCCLSTWPIPCVGADSPVPTVSIPYRDIGPRYDIEGRFGPLFTDLTIKALVVKPSTKRDMSEDDKTVWLNITHIDGKALNPVLSGEMVYSNSKFIEGTEVELIVREEGRLVSGDSIDLILSNPYKAIRGKMVCVLSLRERRTVSSTPPKMTALPTTKSPENMSPR